MTAKLIPRHLKAALGALVVLGLLGVGVGCGIFDPEEKDGDPPPPIQYPPLDSPQHALTNLKLAWESRDSVRTREVYADTYQGVSESDTLNFSKDQEVATVWALGKDPNVIQTGMFLYPESTWVVEKFSSDPENWATIHLISGVRLEVVTNTTTYRAQNSDITYKFERTIAGTDTTWRVVRWTETSL